DSGGDPEGFAGRELDCADAGHLVRLAVEEEIHACRDQCRNEPRETCRRRVEAFDADAVFRLCRLPRRCWAARHLRLDDELRPGSTAAGPGAGPAPGGSCKWPVAGRAPRSGPLAGRKKSTWRASRPRHGSRSASIDGRGGSSPGAPAPGPWPEMLSSIVTAGE